MRTMLFVLVAALAFSACDQEATAPTANKATLAADQSPDGKIIAIGKTRATTVTVVSDEVWYGGFGNPNGYPTGGTTDAYCPAGTTVVGGGYFLYHGDIRDLVIVGTGATNANGWQLNVTELGPSTSAASIMVQAVCLQ